MFYATMIVMMSCLFHLSIFSMNEVKTSLKVNSPKVNRAIVPRNIKPSCENFNSISKTQNIPSDTLTLLTETGKNINNFSSFFELLTYEKKCHLLCLASPSALNLPVVTTKILSTLGRDVQSVFKKELGLPKIIDFFTTRAFQNQSGRYKQLDHKNPVPRHKKCQPSHHTFIKQGALIKNTVNCSDGHNQTTYTMAFDNKYSIEVTQYNKETEHSLVINHEGPIQKATLSFDKKYIATYSPSSPEDPDNVIKITNIPAAENNFKHSSIILVADKEITQWSFTPQSNFFITSSLSLDEHHLHRTTTIDVWDISSGKRVQTSNHEGRLASLCFNHDGTRMFATFKTDSFDTAVLWNTENFADIKTIKNSCFFENKLLKYPYFDTHNEKLIIPTKKSLLFMASTNGTIIKSTPIKPNKHNRVHITLDKSGKFYFTQSTFKHPNKLYDVARLYTTNGNFINSIQTQTKRTKNITLSDNNQYLIITNQHDQILQLPLVNRKTRKNLMWIENETNAFQTYIIYKVYKAIKHNQLVPHDIKKMVFNSHNFPGYMQKFIWNDIVVKTKSKKFNRRR